jgi:hypothetical protein
MGPDGQSMKSSVRIAMAGLAALSLTSCMPSAAEFSKADFGQYPPDYKLAVDTWVQRQLIDPDSRKLSIRLGQRSISLG